MNTDQRTDAELNRIIENWRFGEPQYFVMKRGYFYRVGAAGYTDRPGEAWRVPLEIAKKHEYLRGEEPVTICLADPLPYCTNLNAIHEAWKKLTREQKARFDRELTMVVTLAHMKRPDEWVICAEARSRAEALVAVIQAS